MKDPQGPEKINYNAFREPEDSELKTNENMKVSNSKSMFNKSGPSPSERKQKFEGKVKEYQENDLDLKNRIAEASKKYLISIKDKTLPQNSGPIKKQIEGEAIQELVEIAGILNSNQNLPECIGSMGLINLLLKVNLEQRDLINELAYKVSQLGKE